METTEAHNNFERWQNRSESNPVKVVIVGATPDIEDTVKAVFDKVGISENNHFQVVSALKSEQAAREFRGSGPLGENRLGLVLMDNDMIADEKDIKGNDLKRTWFDILDSESLRHKKFQFGKPIVINISKEKGLLGEDALESPQGPEFDQNLAEVLTTIKNS